MNRQFEEANIVEWLGPDASKIWASSFTVDEHEAYGLFWRALGGWAPSAAVRLSYHRGAFRRAGHGVMPRAWLNPIIVPGEVPLPSYHPKVMLAETPNGYIVVVSTGNLATDDLRHTRNLGVRLGISPRFARQLAAWIERAPRAHRSLCLVVHPNCQDVSEILSSGDNLSTIEQIMKRVERCGRCRTARNREGHWIVAAPFWSSRTIERLLEIENHGSVEAYFRFRAIWDQIALAFRDSAIKDRVRACELRQGGEPQKWHHKIVGWKCCSRPGARSALYVGSANATVCGLVGRDKKAVNWEAGVLWLGGARLFDEARAVARAGFSVANLGPPRNIPKMELLPSDEIGPTDSEELQRVLVAHAARCLRVIRSDRRVTLTARADQPVRALGRRWAARRFEMWLEHKNEFTYRGRLQRGKFLAVPENARGEMRVLFRIDSEVPDAPEGPLFVDVVVDLLELDPEPPLPMVTARTSMASARVGLMSGAWNSTGDGGWDRSAGNSDSLPSDVRFPFGEFFSLRRTRPRSAEAWLDRLAKYDDPTLFKLPEYWRRIARELRKTN